MNPNKAPLRQGDILLERLREKATEHFDYSEMEVLLTQAADMLEGQGAALESLESAGEKLAVEARHRLHDITGDDVTEDELGDPVWSGSQAMALKTWNEARNALRPGTDSDRSNLPGDDGDGGGEENSPVPKGSSPSTSGKDGA